MQSLFYISDLLFYREVVGIFSSSHCLLRCAMPANPGCKCILVFFTLQGTTDQSAAAALFNQASLYHSTPTYQLKYWSALSNVSLFYDIETC